MIDRLTTVIRKWGKDTDHPTPELALQYTFVTVEYYRNYLIYALQFTQRVIAHHFQKADFK